MKHLLILSLLILFSCSKTPETITDKEWTCIKAIDKGRDVLLNCSSIKTGTSFNTENDTCVISICGSTMYRYKVEGSYLYLGQKSAPKGSYYTKFDFTIIDGVLTLSQKDILYQFN